MAYKLSSDYNTFQNLYIFYLQSFYDEMNY